MIAHLLINPEGYSIKQTVLDHLEGTAKIARYLGEPLNIGSLSYLAGLFHDLGKWRKAFEEYINDAANSTKKVNTTLNHSSAGAIFIYQRFYKNDPIQKLTAQLIAYAILTHHGLNDCISPKGINHFGRRINDIDDLDYDEVLLNLNQSNISMNDIDKEFENAKNEVATLVKKFDNSSNDTLYFSRGLLQRMLLSILIDADRIDTAIFYGDRKPEDKNINVNQPWQLMITHLEKHLLRFKNTDEISILRKQISQECLEFSKNSPGIYRLAVPTGGAKTLSSMRYALHHANIHKKKRIFYIAPYLSILEQNAQCFKDAIELEDLILEHHSNVIFENKKDTDIETVDNEELINKHRHLSENWNSPIVLTTFVQFLNTLFAGSTSSIRRFHSLVDSVIIIDEIQSLPIEMIHIFNMTMNYLHEVCNTTIILCSATQPVLDNDSIKKTIHMSEPQDIISDVDGLYNKLKRVNIIEKKGKFDTNKLCLLAAELMEEENDLLIILNTKKAASELFKAIKEYYSEVNEEIILIHLSNNMCPQHRLDCIKNIKEMLGNKKLICVSTSLIEAGVDLSFSTVIRSFAGLDSIAQAAGRCNRNGERKEGKVYVLHYENEYLAYLKQIQKGATCSETVLGSYHNNPEKYKNDLLSRPSMNEFYQRYYFDNDQRYLMDYPLKDMNTNLVELLSINRKGFIAYASHNEKINPDLQIYQAFKTAGENFSVIAHDTVPIIVPYKEGEEIIKDLNGNIQQHDLKKLLKRSQRFTINVYRSKLEELRKTGAIMNICDGEILALEPGFYNDELGMTIEGMHDFLSI